MKRILKREYTAEFREQAVAMVNNGRSVPEVAQELGLINQTLRNWVKAAERGRLNEKAKKVTEEQMELSRLRAENAQLKMENEILKKATAYFAKDRLRNPDDVGTRFRRMSVRHSGRCRYRNPAMSVRSSNG